MAESYPFCVIERPYVQWANQLSSEREGFLNSLDTDFYDRAVFLLAGPSEERDQSVAQEDTGDNSPLLRLLWHHGMEMLVMLFGAFIQAPGAPHAYFLKCKTEDVSQLARLLASEEAPKFTRLKFASFSLEGLLTLIHECAPWSDRELTVGRYQSALLNMLADFTAPQSRWEYNAVKHGLRTQHGRFLMRVGLEHEYGVPPPEDEMRTVGFSETSSSFSVPKPLSKATKDQSKVNFLLDQVTVTWSAEKSLCELRIISTLANNIVGALRIRSGTKPGTVRFLRMVETEWWQLYAAARSSGLKSSSFGPLVEAELQMPTAEDVHESYRSGTWSWPPSADRNK